MKVRWGNAIFGTEVVGVVEYDTTVYIFEESLDTRIFLADSEGIIPSDPHALEGLGARRSNAVFDDLKFTVPVLAPGKVLCVGLNYTDHAREVSADLPDYPTLFTKFDNALVGPTDKISLPRESDKVDWEAELCLVVGRRARRVPEERALEYVFGYTVFNDISVRDWQGRTGEWFQGKNWDNTTPFGPYIVSCDALDPLAGLVISCTVDGVLRQLGNTANMIFTPAQILSYVSTFMTLDPGDLIALGTPAGVGLSLRPRKWLEPGQIVETEIEGIGKMVNVCSEPR